MTKLLGISGSLRTGSTNTLLVKEAARLFGDAELMLGDINLPLYNGDVEASVGVPQAVETLHGQIQAADAIIIATPEYNGNLPGVLKNAFDWVSRCKPMTWGGKPTAIMSAAAGRAGGIRGQNSLRFCLTAFQPHIVHGPEIAVAGGDAFDDAGQLTGEMYLKQLTQLMDNLRAAI